MNSSLVDKDFFAVDTLVVARKLVGCTLQYKECKGIIVETEAYKTDAASHAITRPNTGRILVETYGKIYIYFIYGMYHCLNFTTEKHGVGAVLIRAVEPVEGIDQMFANRGKTALKNLTNGPAKIVMSFNINPKHHGEEVGRSIKVGAPVKEVEVAASPRIGISKAKDLPWRFFAKDNYYVSRTR